VTDPATTYQRSGARLDEHLRTCPSCSAGTACPAGDDTAEAEYRAWRAWERADAQAAHAYRRRGAA
jgi:hypothetical protein